MSKIYSHISKRVSLLKSRNMDISGDPKEKLLLKKYNYYNLVNAYKDPFLYQGSGRVDHYITGTKLSELEALLIFDCNLRNLFLGNILIIEEKIKHELVQSFYEYHQFDNNIINQYEKNNLHKESEYLIRKYYDLISVYTLVNYKRNNRIETQVVNSYINKSREVDKNKIYENFILSAYRTLRHQRRKNNSILSYLSNKEYVPMWVLTNVLTLGEIGNLFTIQKQEVQVKFIKSLNLNRTNLDDKVAIVNTSRIIEILTIYRNICAHGERLYSTTIKIPIDDDYNSFGKKLPYYVDPNINYNIKTHEEKKRKMARSGIFSLIFIFYLFLEQDQFNDFIKKFNKESNTLSDQLKTIDITKIKRIMGLNFEWSKFIKVG